MKVTKLERRPDGSVGPVIDIGPQTVLQLLSEERTTEIIQSYAAIARSIYLIEWEGDSLSPRGADLDGVIVGQTRHGMVTTMDHDHVGVCARLVDHGGDSHKEHKMLIFLK